jgi:hypothetical protein
MPVANLRWSCANQISREVRWVKPKVVVELT